MRPSETQTWREIAEIPGLLERFSQDAPERLAGSALKASDESVYLVGRGSSDNATLFAKYIWETYAGVRTDFIHPHAIFEAKRPLNFKGRVVWAFSQSGKSADVVECVKKLAAWGAACVAVTNEPVPMQNPLAAAAHRHILLSDSKELAVAATKTFSLQLWLAFWTAHVWRGWPLPGHLAKTRRAIADYLAKPRAFPPAGRFKPFWKDLGKAPVIAFVGRGPFFAVAKDAALKFREMAGAHAAAYSAADFLHGPIGAYGPKDMVLLLSPSDKQVPDDLEKVRQALAARKTLHAVLAPVAGESPFHSLLLDIELKLAALALALEKGRDPDRPKGLSKVTITL